MPPTTADGQSSGGLGVPLPDDDADLGGSQTSTTPQPPWQSIPKFTPGTTNVQEYVQKLKFLAAMWPAEHLPQLAPRAALLVEGTAFKKVARLDPSKLKVANQSGIALLVDAIGGSWGSTELEERYEYFERALYGTVQRHDESHDSFLARMEANFVELLSRGTTLEEVQAYVLLRQSTLPAEDKKRILLEHEGELRYKPVVKSYRLLGSKFFSEFQSGRSSNKTKVYDVNMSETPDSETIDAHDRAFHAYAEDLDQDLDFEVIEALAAQEDADALTICAFENELEEFMQETPQMHEAMVTYMEARARLLEKRKNRGFWPTKGRGKAFKGGKSKGKRSRDREQLLARISRSHCRKCGALGHWKAECPQNNVDKSSGAGATASANVAVNETEPYADEVYSETEDVCDHQAGIQKGISMITETCFMAMSQVTDEDRHRLQSRMSSFLQCCRSRPDPKSGVNKWGINKWDYKGIKHPSQPAFRDQCLRVPEKPKTSSMSSHSTVPRNPPEILMQPLVTDVNQAEPIEESVLISTMDARSSHAILDTGASRCIIGEKTLQALKGCLAVDVQSRLKTSPSKIKFRFGNNQTLTSSYRVHFPLKAQDSRTVWLAVEVVEGATPFLFSKRAFKLLGGSLDTTTDTCCMHRLHSEAIPLEVSRTGLYLINIGDLCQGDTNDHAKCSVAYVGEPCPGKTPMHAGIHGKNMQRDVQFSFGHQAGKPFRTKSATTAVSDPNHSSVLQNVTTETPQHAVFRHAFQGRCRSLDSSDDHAATDVDSTSRSADGSTRSERSPPGNESADSAHDGGAPQSKGYTGSSSATTEVRSSLNGKDQDGSVESSCSLQDPHKDSSGRSSIWNWKQSKDDVSRRKFNANDVVPGRVRRGRAGGRRGARDCGDHHNTDSSNLSGGALSSDSPSLRRLGQACDHLGQETQGQDLRTGDDHGRGLFRMVPEALHLTDTRDEGVCQVRPTSSDALGGRELNKFGLNDADFHKEVQQARQDLQKTNSSDNKDTSTLVDSVLKAESIFDQHMCERQKFSQFSKDRLFLLEIYAESHSPLTDAVRNLGLPSRRFTKADGDLSTISGRAKLWNLIEEYQPEHIWVAPECGPWSGWNRLNQSKSLDMFDNIQFKQNQQLPHLQLCTRRCKYQVTRDRHFHMEQPKGSGALKQEIIKPIFQHACIATFDMCRFGLRLPKTNKFLKKGSVLVTTSQPMFEILDGQRCPQNHSHQRIEGSFQHDGMSTRMAHFCASYCQGFAKTVAKFLCQLNHSHWNSQDAMVHDLDINEPPAKRIRFSFNLSKHRKPDRSIDLDPEQNQAPIPMPEDPGEMSSKDDGNHMSPWFDVLQLAQKNAPRVGNSRCPADSELFSMAKALLNDMVLESLFICRGTERFQVPVQAPASHACPLRRTICVHRQTNEVHDLGTEDWHCMTRAKRIRNCLPSKITITMFGSKKTDESANAELPESSRDGTNLVSRNETLPSDERPSAIRVSHESQLPPSVTERTPNQVCEGWAPPPIALHGPKFRLLSDVEKSDLIKVHKNLGHPDPTQLAAHLQQLGANPKIIEAAREFVCDACVESSAFRHQRPAQLHDAAEFNDTVGIDGFFWTGRAGFQVMVFHCIDEASLFHLGRRLENRNLEHVIPALSDMWLSWAGSPANLYSDPAGEFVSDQWLSFLQSHSISPKLSTESWQKGRVERHGALVKEMLKRYDMEKTIQSVQEFDTVLRACFQAKNALSRHRGYSPEQIVLGKAARLPASLSSDETLSSHSMATGEDLESERFRQQLEIRTIARKAFLTSDNSEAIRRALLRRSCPVRGPFEAGQQVMYWRKINRANRREGGRWHGPARVVSQQGSSTVWIAHAHRLLKCAPESLRPASLREWQGNMEPLSQMLPQTSETQQHVPQSHVQSEMPEAMEYSPGTPISNLPSPHSHHTSVQPESEMFPEVPDHGSQQTTHENSDSAADPPAATEAEFLEPPNVPAQDPPIDLEDIDDDLLCEKVLWCSDVPDQNPYDEPLHEWTCFQPGDQHNEICFADDDMPMLENPLEPNDEQCYMLEVPMSRQDLMKWSCDNHPEEMAAVASAGKRARAEVQLKDLTSADRHLFDIAKDAELTCWLQTSALKHIFRKSLNPEQILRSRWVLTWKPVEGPDGQRAGS